METIDKLLLKYKYKAVFEQELAAGKVKSDSIAFIEDTKEIYAQGSYYGSGALSQEEIQQLIDNSIDEIVIGGRNFAKGTNQGTTNWQWENATGGATLTEVIEDGIRCCKMVRDDN